MFRTEVCFWYPSAFLLFVAKRYIPQQVSGEVNRKYPPKQDGTTWTFNPYTDHTWAPQYTIVTRRYSKLIMPIADQGLKR